MKRISPFLIFLAVFISSTAQTPEIDKLSEQINNTIFVKQDSAKIYLLRLLEHSEELHDTMIGKTYSNLGILYNQKAIFDSSEFYLKKGISFTEKYPYVQARMYLNLAINYRTSSRYEESLGALNKAILLYKKANNREGEGLVYGEMASNYNYMLNSEKALEYLKKAIAILTEVGNTREIYAVKQKLANLYNNNGDFTFAKDLYEDVLPYFAQKKGTNYYYTLLNYGDCLIQFEDYKEAEKAFLEVETGLKQMGNKEYLFVAISKLGNIYAKTNRNTQAQKALKEAYEGLFQVNSPRFMEVAAQYLEFLNDNKDYSEAVQVVDKVNASSKIPRLKMNADNEIVFLKNAIATYSQRGMVEKSLAAFERMDFLKDSMNGAINKVKILELKAAYQNDLQREKNLILAKNNELLKENNSKQQNILILSFLLLLLLFIIALGFYITNKNKLALKEKMVQSLENSKQVLEEKNILEGQLLQEREQTLENKEKELIDISLEMANVQNKILELIEVRENPEY